MTTREHVRDSVVKRLFAIAVLARLLMLVLFWGQPLSIVDEQHYDGLAARLVESGRYVSPTGEPTAIRPPLYPAMLALTYRIFSAHRHDAVRFLQSLLSLVGGVLLLMLSRSLLDVRTARVAVGAFLLYPSMLFYDCLILTEILFTVLFLAALVCIARSLGGDRIGILAAGGCLLGLATLTRSITYPMVIPFVLMLVALLNPRRARSWAAVGLFGLSFLLALSPWIARNQRVFAAFVPVDTMGGLNLFMGNYEHTPLHRAWAAVDVTGEKAWYHGHERELTGMNEAQKQQWATRAGLAFMAEHPGLSSLRTVVKAANFWGMDRALVAQMHYGFFQAFTSLPAKVVAGALILACYASLMLLGFSGLVGRLVVERTPFDIVAAFLLLYFTGMHALVFGHSRYHLPLVPLLCMYAGWALTHGKGLLGTRRRLTLVAAGCVALIFLAIWLYDLAVLFGKDELARVFSI